MNMGRIDKYTMKYRDKMYNVVDDKVKDSDIVNELNNIRQREQDDEYNIYSHPQSGNIVVDAKLEGLDNYSFMVDTTLITSDMDNSISSDKERIYFRYKCSAPKTTALGWSQVVDESKIEDYKQNPLYDEYRNLAKRTGIWALQPGDDDQENINPFYDKKGKKITITKQLNIGDDLTKFDENNAYNGAELRGVEISEVSKSGENSTGYPITYYNENDNNNIEVNIYYINQSTKALERYEFQGHSDFFRIINDANIDGQEYYTIYTDILGKPGTIYLKIIDKTTGDYYWSDVKKEDVLLFCNNPFFNYNEESQSIELYFYSNNEAGIRDAVTNDNQDAQQEEKLFTITTVPYSDICKYNNLKRSITLDINKVNSGLCYISNYRYTKDEDTMQIQMTLNNYAKDEGYVSRFFIEAFAPFENKSIFYDISPLVTDNHISFTLNPIITKDGEMVFTPATNGMLDINSNSSAELFIENGIDRSQIASGNIDKYAFSFSNSLSVEEKRFYILRFILFDENGGRITTILDGKGRVNDVRCLYTTGMFNDNTEQDFMDCLVREKVDEYGELECRYQPNPINNEPIFTDYSHAYSLPENPNEAVYLKSDYELVSSINTVKCVVKNKNQELFDIVGLKYKSEGRFFLDNFDKSVIIGSNDYEKDGLTYYPEYTYSLNQADIDVIDSYKPKDIINRYTGQIEITKDQNTSGRRHKTIVCNYSNETNTYSIDYKDTFSLFTFGITDKNSIKEFNNTNLHPIFFEKMGKQWLKDKLIDNLSTDNTELYFTNNSLYAYEKSDLKQRSNYKIKAKYSTAISDSDWNNNLVSGSNFIEEFYIPTTYDSTGNPIVQKYSLDEIQYSFVNGYNFRVALLCNKDFDDKDKKTFVSKNKDLTSQIVFVKMVGGIEQCFNIQRGQFNLDSGWISYQVHDGDRHETSEGGGAMQSNFEYVNKQKMPLFHFVLYDNGQASGLDPGFCVEDGGFEENHDNEENTSVCSVNYVDTNAGDEYSIGDGGGVEYKKVLSSGANIGIPVGLLTAGGISIGIAYSSSVVGISAVFAGTAGASSVIPGVGWIIAGAALIASAISFGIAKLVRGRQKKNELKYIGEAPRREDDKTYRLLKLSAFSYCPKDYDPQSDTSDSITLANSEHVISNWETRALIDCVMRFSYGGNKGNIMSLPLPVLFHDVQSDPREIHTQPAVFSLINQPTIFLRQFIYALKHIVVPFTNTSYNQTLYENTKIDILTPIPNSENISKLNTDFDIEQESIVNKNTFNPFSFTKHSTISMPKFHIGSIKTLINVDTQNSLEYSYKNFLQSGVCVNNCEYKDLYSNFDFNVNTIIQNNETISPRFDFNKFSHAARTFDGKVMIEDCNHNPISQNKSYIYYSEVPLMVKLFNGGFPGSQNFGEGQIKEIEDGDCMTLLNIKLHAQCLLDNDNSSIFPVFTPFHLMYFSNLHFDASIENDGQFDVQLDLNDTKKWMLEVSPKKQLAQVARINSPNQYQYSWFLNQFLLDKQLRHFYNRKNQRFVRYNVNFNYDTQFTTKLKP